MKYTMKQLEAIINRPPQTIRRILRNNPQLEQYKEVKPNKNVLFGEEILDFLKDYFEIADENTSKISPAVESGVGVGENITENSDNPQTNPPHTAHGTASAGVEDELRARIEALEADLTAKQERIDDLEAEEVSKLIYIETTEKKLSEATGNFEAAQTRLDAMRQTCDSLTEANAALKSQCEALEGQIAALTDRIAAQKQELIEKNDQIKGLIYSNDALSLTVKEAQSERLLAEAKKQNIFVRLKNRLTGKKPVIVAAETTETADK